MPIRATQPIGLLWAARARLAQGRVRRRAVPREQFVRRHAPGRSFADIGAMWNVDGGLSFLAEDCGATTVTAVDVMAPTARYGAEHARRRSRVRFVSGDIHDPAVVSEIGLHDVVWCSGVLYHAPNPVLTLERLRSITAETLILATETIPEVPGLPHACVFLPALSDADRMLHQALHPTGLAHGIHTPFARDQSYAAWWWGISRSALRGMLHASGFEVREEHGGPLHATVVATPVA